MSDRDRRNEFRKPRQTSQSNDNRSEHSRSSRGYTGGGRSHSYNRINNGTVLYILDILQHGGVDQAGHSWQPIGQVIEVPGFNLLEVTYNKKRIAELKLQQKIIYRESDDGLIIRSNKKLKYDQLTPASVQTIGFVLEQYIVENEERFIKFVNNVGPITIKRHYLEVLPGVGKKLMNEILSARQHQPFISFEDLHTRIPGFKPVDVFTKRIIEELEDEEQKHYLFVKRQKPEDHQGSSSRNYSQNGERRTSRNDSFKKRY